MVRYKEPSSLNYDVDDNTQAALPPVYDTADPTDFVPHGFIGRAIEGIEPIPVKLVNDQGGAIPVKDVAPDFGTGVTVTLPAGVFQPRQLLPQSNKRKRAVIQVQPGIAGNNLGSCYIGSQQQMNAGNAAAAANGLKLITGSNITIEAKSEVWIAGDGVNSLTIVAWDERYQ